MGEAILIPTAERSGPEAEIIGDMLRRGMPGLPVLVVLAGIGWGWHGALSAAFAIGLVVLNFVLTAVTLTFTGRVSVTMLMAGVLVGYAVRMGLVVLALFLVRDAAWVEMVPLAITLVVTHLGLLFWETRHVSASLAFPGVKPSSLPRARRTAREEAGR